ncbi:MAG: coproporphyrinogen III oxidase, partial [Bacteroidetes bacterium]|nr:coproporphyrinogen III oxidase [Bacteroidota bacterium]
LPAVENEVLTTENRHNEYIMLSLRTIWGMNIEKLQRDFGRKNSDIFKAKAVKFLSEGKMKIVNNCYILSKEGKKFADGIASEFFI